MTNRDIKRLSRCCAPQSLYQAPPSWIRIQGAKEPGNFFDAAHLNPKAPLITGVVCGVRVENVDDALMQQINAVNFLGYVLLPFFNAQTMRSGMGWAPGWGWR